MILPIVTAPNPILLEKAAQITEVTPEIRQLALDMRETMHNAQGLGLAAPQVGKPIALIVIELRDEDPREAIPFLALVNPRVTWRGTKQTHYAEGCLSIPGLEGQVQRPERVRVKAKDLDGNVVEIDADGMLARVLQHEIDHLNGILFTDYVKKRDLQKRPIVDYPTM